MYYIVKKEGQFSVVQNRETLDSAIKSVEAFAEAHQLECNGMSCDDGNRFPEVEAHIEFKTNDGHIWKVLSRDQAKQYYRANREVYVMYDDHSESLVESEDDFVWKADAFLFVTNK